MHKYSKIRSFIQDAINHCTAPSLSNCRRHLLIALKEIESKESKQNKRQTFADQYLERSKQLNAEWDQRLKEGIKRSIERLQNPDNPV